MGPGFAVLLGTLHALTECVGCHTPARALAPAHFEVGLGRWTEAQCYGCHHEINEVVREGVVNGHKDERYWSLPLTEERRVYLARTPLSLTTSPEHVVTKAGARTRIDASRLLDFLQRPVDVRRSSDESDHMLAYPELDAGDLPALLTVLDEATPESSVRAFASLVSVPLSQFEAVTQQPDSGQTGEQLFTAKCRACHESVRALSGRGPAYLALFTADWLFGYANRAVHIPGQARRMPRVEITPTQSARLYAYFGAERQRLAREVDARVAALDERAVGERTRGRMLSSQEREFVWDGLLRQGKCVHCHGAEGSRAATKLYANAWGLRRYVREHGGMAVWRRLEIRAIEAALGMSASTVGMPMANPPLTQELRDLVYVWAREGCPLPSSSESSCPTSTELRGAKP